MRDWRTGSLRERRRGVWEIRIAVATDPLTGRSLQRSFTVRGDRADAEARCVELAGDHAGCRVQLQAAPFVTVGEILGRWLDSDHDWKPSTWSSYRSNARAIQHDTIAGVRVARVSPVSVRATLARWRSDGVTPAVLSGRFRTLQSALGWAYEHRLVERNPIEGLRGPAQPEPRLHAPFGDVVTLIRFAEQQVEKARVEADGGKRAARDLHRAEQLLLLVRLAADAGARRGELAALKIGDLQGQVLSITRAVSMEQLGPTKTRGRCRAGHLASTRRSRTRRPQSAVPDADCEAPFLAVSVSRPPIAVLRSPLARGRRTVNDCQYPHSPTGTRVRLRARRGHGRSTTEASVWIRAREAALL